MHRTPGGRWKVVGALRHSHNRRETPVVRVINVKFAFPSPLHGGRVVERQAWDIVYSHKFQVQLGKPALRGATAKQVSFPTSVGFLLLRFVKIPDTFCAHL
jgi:hypothetical protein